MTNKNCRSTGATVIYLILLVALIYAFHVDLFVSGLRLFTFFSDSPRSERLLGDYYQNLSIRSAERSNTFYKRALKKLQAQLPNDNPKKEAYFKAKIGYLYMCGKGVPQDLKEAKKWYEDAAGSYKKVDANTNKDPSKDTNKDPKNISNEIEQNLEQLNKANNNGTEILISCQFPSNQQFIINIFTPDND